MKRAKLQLSVGALVLVGAALLVAFVLFLTGDRLRSAALFETYLSESVQGLEIGAAVRFRGVAVGRVTQIGLVHNVYRRSSGEPYSGEFRQVIVRFGLDTAVANPGVSLDDAVASGLRARLASQGITGIVYIELDFVDPERFPPGTPPWTPAYGWIPAIPSTIAQVQNAAETLLRRLENVDIAALVDNVAGLIGNLREETQGQGDVAVLLREARSAMGTIRQKAETTDITAVVEEFRAAAAAMRALASSPELRQAIAASGQAAADLRQATARLPAVIQGLEATLRGAEVTLRTARGTTSDLQAEFAPILRDLRATAANLRDTTELMRRSPGQALFGAPPPAPADAGARR
jgi:ABC-type transporter Mla subunit MlaD